jgi:hypothetical protein
MLVHIVITTLAELEDNTPFERFALPRPFLLASSDTVATAILDLVSLRSVLTKARSRLESRKPAGCLSAERLDHSVVLETLTRKFLS